jgi:hypothetical protein
MATATSSPADRRARRPAWAVAGAVLIVLLAVAASTTGSIPSPARPRSAFGWLQPAAPAPDWNLGRTASGATLAYPPSWRPIATDRGTVSAAPAVPGGAFVGYLNATPRGGTETLKNWSRFRVAHNADEGSRHIRLIAAGRNLAFRGGRGSCVIDDYSTTATRFREIACIVAGSRATNVIVAAAPVGRWGAEAPQLERGVASFSA